MNRLDVVLLRLSGGRLSVIGRAPTPVLHHVGRRSGQARATPLIFLEKVASLEEKAASWPELVANYPEYDTYAGYTDREVPVVVLEPRR